MGDSQIKFCHPTLSKERSRGTFFLPSSLELARQMFGMNSRSWPFAHLADALRGIDTVKQNLVMQEVLNFEKNQDSCREGFNSNNFGKRLSSSTLAISFEFKPIHDKERPDIQAFGETMKKAPAKCSNPSLERERECQDVARNGLDKQVVQDLVKSVHNLSNLSSGFCEKEETWSNNNVLSAVNIMGQTLDPHPASTLHLSGSSFSKGQRSRRQGIKFEGQTQQSWEFVLTSEPLPSVLLGESSPGSFSTPELHVANSLLRTSKFTSRKISMQLSSKHTSASKKMLKISDCQMANEKVGVKRNQNVQTVRVLKQLLCGGFAGVVSRTLVAPLDLIKTYLITSHGSRGSKKSALAICLEIVEHDGWQGLFRGNLVNCLRVAPSKAIELCVFETVRRSLNGEGHPLKHAAATIAGGAAGMAGTAATYPLELLRTRLSVQPELYSSLSQAIRKIAQEEGFSAFYSGLSPSLVGVFPYAATNYFVYDGLRGAYCRSTGQQNVPTLPTLVFGAIAAAASSTVTYPLEVARRQMQLSFSGAVVKRSTVGVILDIYQHEGMLALYRGLGTTWLKLIPAAGISLMCYEAARLALQIDDASLVKPEEIILADQEPQY